MRIVKIIIKKIVKLYNLVILSLTKAFSTKRSCIAVINSFWHDEILKSHKILSEGTTYKANCEDRAQKNNFKCFIIDE